MSKGILQKKVEIQGLATAILLPSVGVFGGPIGSEVGEVGPLTCVVGIGLFQRTVLTLQRAGIRQLIVLSGPDEEQLKHSLSKGPRVTIPVRWMPIREFPLDDPRTWEALAAEVRGFALIASVNGVFSRGLIEQLRQDVRDGHAIVVTESRLQEGAPPRNSGVRVTIPSPGLATMASARLDESALQVAELLVVPASLMNAASLSTHEKGRTPVRQWIEQVAGDGRLHVVTAEEKRGTWYQP
ncbi:MAG: hypothetical protein OEV01_10780, partial [Nitrospira sp.]|nr:hypothetical protein [Nitrospira sp.]